MAWAQCGTHYLDGNPRRATKDPCACAPHTSTDNDGTNIAPDSHSHSCSYSCSNSCSYSCPHPCANAAAAGVRADGRRSVQPRSFCAIRHVGIHPYRAVCGVRPGPLCRAQRLFLLCRMPDRSAAASPGSARVPQAAHTCAISRTNDVADAVSDPHAHTNAVSSADTRPDGCSRAHACSNASGCAAPTVAYTTTVAPRHAVSDCTHRRWDTSHQHGRTDTTPSVGSCKGARSDARKCGR